MFKEEDLVIYIGEYIRSWGLIPYKMYTIGIVGEDYLYLKNEHIPGLIGPYNTKFFISIIDYRKQKIEKICSKLVI